MNSIRQSFNRAAPSYDQVANLQTQVANTLATLVKNHLPHSFRGLLLDAGCGTGYCLNALQPAYPDARLLALDFADDMLRQLPAALSDQRINADLQALPLSSAVLDVYLSSLAWQWCDNQVAAREAARTLKPHGDFFAATLVSGTFKELASTLAAADLSPAQHVLNCALPQTVHQCLEKAGLNILSSRVESMTTWHPDFKSLRHSIRGVGANHLAIGKTTPIGRQARGRLIDAYEDLRTATGLPLTYDVLFIHARKCGTPS